jgi:RHS repeat-associated protein
LLTTLAPGIQLTTNTWDGENRLTKVALPTAIVDSFTYNGDGQRVQKQDSTGTTNHIWDEQNILLETNASNIVQVAYTLEPLVYGNLVSQSRGGVDSFYLFDALGSARELTGTGTSIASQYIYDSWGNLVFTSGSIKNPYTFQGRCGCYFDVDSGVFQLRARYYVSTPARFLSRDPIAAAHDANSYRAFLNNPLRYSDCSGLKPKPHYCSKNGKTCNQTVLGNALASACDCVNDALDLMENHFDLLEQRYGKMAGALQVILKEREWYIANLRLISNSLCNGKQEVYFYCCAKGQTGFPGWGCANCANPETEPSAYVWPTGDKKKPLLDRYIYICPGFWPSNGKETTIFHELGRLVGIEGPNFRGDKYDAYVWDDISKLICVASPIIRQKI